MIKFIEKKVFIIRTIFRLILKKQYNLKFKSYKDILNYFFSNQYRFSLIIRFFQK